MDRLKKILKRALVEHAQRIRLTAGKAPEFKNSDSTRELADEPIFAQAEIEQFYGFLFPSEQDKAQIANKQRIRGALNVPSVGKILLIAQPENTASLRLYLPPDSNDLFESDWSRPDQADQSRDLEKPLNAIEIMESPSFDHDSRSNSVAPRGLEMPPQSPDAGGINIFTPPDDISGDHVAIPEMVPPPPVVIATELAGPSESGATSNDLPTGFIPADMFATPVVEPPKVVATKQVQSEAQLAAPSTASPIAFQSNEAINAKPSAVSGANPEQKLGPSVASEERPTINFAPEADGEASDGSNAIDPILTEMIRRKASDVHITCGEPICFRVDGDVERINDQAIDAQKMAAFLLPIMPIRNQQEFAKTNDTDFAYEVHGVGRFRVNVFRDKNGVGTVMRHIPSKILTADQLGLSATILKFCTLSKGLVLVTGPTGSGKSTTLAAMIDYINKTRHDHILTIEDPVEFVHPQQKCLVNQREVHKHTGSFARALKAALREDPDIVLIGEMRDLETIAIAIETAETGHLVFGTLHTTTAVSTIDRIIDQFPSDRQEQIRMMLSTSLRGVVAQTLLKKKGGGRCAAQEILVSSDAVGAMIREGKNYMIPNHMQSQRQDGNVLLNECLAKLIKDDLVEVDEAYRKSVDKTAFIDIMKRIGIKTDHLVAPQATPVTNASPAQPNRKAG